MTPFTSLVFLLARILSDALWVYLWIVIIAAVITWIEPNPYNPIVRFLYSITEPVFDFVRGHVPVVFAGIDFSPIIVIVVIEIVQGWLIPVIVSLLTGVPMMA
ncbi:MAG: YggT family protein [Candidatus Binataceae bacterium]